MRLLNTTTLEIHEFPGDSDEKYAILSHRWREDECELQHMSMPDVVLRKGYHKIKFCCEQALKDHLDWAWVDTCCIDKTSTAELSEAINSMFRWYQNAQVCYAYLDDVTDLDGLGESLWFSRGWTLQELIAPKIVWFYSSSWTYLGSKVDLAAQLHSYTGIEHFVLSTGRFDRVCMAHRMEWAAKRKTTRIEDQAYCLLGIFDVNLPLIYGEGRKAFLRLQQEIVKVHPDDETLFAWGLPEHTQLYHDVIPGPSQPGPSQTYGMFASSPSDFIRGHEIRHTGSLQPLELSTIYGNGLKGRFTVLHSKHVDIVVLTNSVTRYENEGFTVYVGIVLREWTSGNWARDKSLVLVPARQTSMFKVMDTIIREPRPPRFHDLPTSISLIRIPSEYDNFVVNEVYCLPHATYIQEEQRITLPTKTSGPHGVIFFTPRVYDEDGYDFPFAIVLTCDGNHIYDFVPIIGLEDPDDYFHRIAYEDGELAERCMTKEQLKTRLVEGRGCVSVRTQQEVGNERTVRIEPLYHRAVAISRLGADIGRPGFPTYKYHRYGRKVKRADASRKWEQWIPQEIWLGALVIGTYTGPLDFVDTTTYVCFQFLEYKSTGIENTGRPEAGRSINSRREIPIIKRQEAQREFRAEVEKRLRSWWLMKALEWFEERSEERSEERIESDLGSVSPPYSGSQSD